MTDPAVNYLIERHTNMLSEHICGLFMLTL